MQMSRDLTSKVKGKKNLSTIYMLVSKGYNNFVSSSDPEIVNNIKLFMTNLQTDIHNYDLKQKTKALQEDLEKQNKEHDKLLKQQDKIDSQLKKNEKQIANDKDLMNNLK